MALISYLFTLLFFEQVFWLVFLRAILKISEAALIKLGCLVDLLLQPKNKCTLIMLM